MAMTGELEDREAIRQVITRYFVAQDNRQRDAVLELFADDARLSMHGVEVADGRDAIAAYFSSERALEAMGVDREQILSTHHMMGTHLVDLRDENASAVTYAVAYIALDHDGREDLLVRGLRYLDELRRTRDGWRIVDRVHTSDWAYITPRHEAIRYADRVIR